VCSKLFDDASIWQWKREILHRLVLVVDFFVKNLLSTMRVYLAETKMIRQARSRVVSLMPEMVPNDPQTSMEIDTHDFYYQ